MAGPVLNCDTPGVFDRASIKLVLADLNKSSFFKIEIGVGVLRELVARKKLVTVTFEFSTALCPNAIFSIAFAFITIVLEYSA